MIRALREDATIQDAIALLSDKGFSAAPVINKAGHPVGVVSRSDILVHDREKAEYAVPAPNYYEEEEIRARTGAFKGEGFQIVDVDRTLVSEIMTPVVFSVLPETPARKVVKLKILFAGLALLVAVPALSGDEKEPNKLGKLMRRKLQSAQKLLEGAGSGGLRQDHQACRRINGHQQGGRMARSQDSTV
jgi:CBS domain-containing protein